MRQRNRSWPTVIGTAVLTGGLFYVAMTLVYRFIRGDGWDWSRASGGAIALALMYLGVGAAVRWRWIPTSKDGDPADQEP